MSAGVVGDPLGGTAGNVAGDDMLSADYANQVGVDTSPGSTAIAGGTTADYANILANEPGISDGTALGDVAFGPSAAIDAGRLGDLNSAFYPDDAPLASASVDQGRLGELNAAVAPDDATSAGAESGDDYAITGDHTVTES